MLQLVKNQMFQQPKNSRNFENGVGSWRLKDKSIRLPARQWSLRIKHEIEIQALELNHLDVPDEWDTTAICKQVQEHKRVMARAEYAGCGKSYAARYMGKLKHKVLCVCPTNKLTQNKKENGVTLNKFFSIGMTEDSNLARFDDDPYDVIVFDEIYVANVRMLARIEQHADNNPDKIIVATGDTNQLETCDPLVEELGDQYDAYVNQCIDSIFPHAMFLTE